MATRNRVQAAKDSRNYRARHRAAIALRARARRQADPARRALHVRNYRARKRARRLAACIAAARWRAANPDRARSQWRAYYYRRRKLILCGVDPAVLT